MYRLVVKVFFMNIISSVVPFICPNRDIQVGDAKYQRRRANGNLAPLERDTVSFSGIKPKAPGIVEETVDVSKKKDIKKN